MFTVCRYTKFKRVDKWGLFKIPNLKPEYKKLNFKKNVQPIKKAPVQHSVWSQVFLYTKHVPNFL